MIARINGREKTKQDLQVCLRLGGEVRLSEALLSLGGSKSSETQALGSLRHGFLRLGGDQHLGVERRIFHIWVVSPFSP